MKQAVSTFLAIAGVIALFILLMSLTSKTELVPAPSPTPSGVSRDR